jgi:hypothetical protein
MRLVGHCSSIYRLSCAELVGRRHTILGQFRRQLEQSETALLHGNRAVLFRHGRWHYLTLGDQGDGMGNFLSPARAELALSIQYLRQN